MFDRQQVWAMQVGQRLANARKNAGFSLREAVRQTGISLSNICRIEDGRFLSIQTDTLLKLCRAYGIEAGTVLDTTDSSDSSTE